MTGVHSYSVFSAAHDQRSFLSKYIAMAHRYFLATPLKSAIEVGKLALIQAPEAGPKLSPEVRAVHSAEGALKVNAPVA